MAIIIKTFIGDCSIHHDGNVKKSETARLQRKRFVIIFGKKKSKKDIIYCIYLHTHT